MKKKIFLKFFLLLTLLTNLCACSKADHNLILSIDRVENKVTKSVFKEIKNTVIGEKDNNDDLSLEYLFYKYGIKMVDEICLTQTERSYTFAWKDVADSAYWRDLNEIEIEGKDYLADRVDVKTKKFEEPISYSITDIASLTAKILGISFGEKETTFDVSSYSSVERVVWFFLDGFGYDGFRYAEKEGLIPNLVNLGKLYPAFTIYPPQTNTATAALLSGLDSLQNGVLKGGVRSLSVPSILDAVSGAGKSVSIVEGSSTPFNYPNMKVTLSGDRNSNGSTDDEVFAHAQQVITTELPSLLFIHFHGIDDFGHTYGPYSYEWKEKVTEIDSMVSQLIEQLPEKTLVIIFPDHGMHAAKDESELGNHGHLLEEDMLIYFILFQK